MDYKIWTNIPRTILLRQWENGQMELATRPECTHTWGPPVTLYEEAENGSLVREPENQLIGRVVAEMTNTEVARALANARRRRDAYSEGKVPSELLDLVSLLVKEETKRRQNRIEGYPERRLDFSVKRGPRNAE